MKNTDRPQCDDCCRRTAYPALARTIRTLKGLLPSPNTTCGTRTLSHTVPGRLKYTVLQPSSTRGVGGRKAVLAGLPRCTHLLAQSGPQGLLPSPNTTCGTRTLSHTVPGRLKYTVPQPSSTRGGGGRKAVLAGLPRCTHILAQSGPQARTSAPLPRYTKLSQNLQQRGKPKRNSAQAGHTTS